MIFLAASIGMLRTRASEERISVSFSPCTRRISSFVARAVQTVSPDLSLTVRSHPCIFSPSFTHEVEILSISSLPSTPKFLNHVQIIDYIISILHKI